MRVRRNATSFQAAICDLNEKATRTSRKLALLQNTIAKEYLTCNSKIPWLELVALLREFALCFLNGY